MVRKCIFHLLEMKEGKRYCIVKERKMQYIEFGKQNKEDVNLLEKFMGKSDGMERFGYEEKVSF